MTQSGHDNPGSPEEWYPLTTLEQKKKKFGNFSIIALLLLITALLMIEFNLRLIAGILLISSAALIILNLKNTTNFINGVKDSFNITSSSAEKKDEIITDLSHRIREPLNNIGIIGDLLMNTELHKNQRELVETLLASSNNMVNAMNELTMQSAAIKSQKSGDNIRYNILSTIQNTIDLYRLKENSGLDIIFSKKDLNEYDCFGDPVFLKQIFLDLLNTIEMQSRRKAKVTIGVKKESETDHSMIVSFRIQTDNKMELISQDEKSGNLIIKLMNFKNGTYNTESGENYTVLNLILPFERSQSVNSHSQRFTSDTRKKKSHKEIKDINVLLVEDNLITQKITLLTLRSLVKSIDTATNGKEAIDKLAESDYDLILLDIQMPVMDGILAAEKIRERERGSESHIPIIAITADAMIGDKERCISAGIDDYISKPFQPSVLIEKIKILI